MQASSCPYHNKRLEPCWDVRDGLQNHPCLLLTLHPFHRSVFGDEWMSMMLITMLRHFLFVSLGQYLFYCQSLAQLMEWHTKHHFVDEIMYVPIDSLWGYNKKRQTFKDVPCYLCPHGL
ncbi:hypothetical protein O6H91_04G065200 [Diphasiastrum complanatum]|uniref:Uncharacterized protein n=1 Tax=Diphasiastrum complanatum TaxID=34168 RepID=A0ACC2DXU8_DIPCM|nr:hypothetical protein O6H91_04G065200 [Diphasiastrum complanatum]